MSTQARIRELCDVPVPKSGSTVVYWMHGAVRAHGNPALEEAIAWANALDLPLVVYGQPVLRGPLATERRAIFLMEGMAEVEARLASRGIRLAFYVPPDAGAPPSMIQRLLDETAALVCDWDPHSPFRGPLRKIAEREAFPIRLVDSCHLFPRKELQKAMQEGRLDALVARERERLAPPADPVELAHPSLELKIRFKASSLAGRDVEALAQAMDLDHLAPPSADLRGGLTEARRRLSSFIDAGLPRFPGCTVDPSTPGGSGLSPWLACGQLGPMEVVQSVRSAKAPEAARRAFLDRLFVDRSRAFARRNWSPRNGLDRLESEARNALEAFDFEGSPSVPMFDVEAARTGRAPFDAAQTELRCRGVIHPAMRLHWGATVLSTAPSAEEGLQRLLRLQTRWSLDGGGAEGHEGLLAACVALGRPDDAVPEKGVEAYVETMTELGRQCESRLAAADERERDASRRRRH